MIYIPEESKVIYQSKDEKKEKIFDALEWLAAMKRGHPLKGESREKTPLHGKKSLSFSLGSYYQYQHGFVFTPSSHPLFLF